jgi:hypothetical protein
MRNAERSRGGGNHATTGPAPQGSQLEFHPYPIVVEELDHDPRHLTSGVWFADGWNAFPAGYPSFKEKGAVFWAGNIRSALPEPNCDLEKSGPVARGRLKESRPRTSYGGPPGSLNAACALGPWDPLRHRQRHDVVDRHTQRRGSRGI